MTGIGWSYSSSEVGYVATLQLTGDVHLHVMLTEKGYVTLRKCETADGDYERVSVSTLTDESEYHVYGSVRYPYLKIITSVEPNTIEYANI